jgi:hypothetical protein
MDGIDDLVQGLLIPDKGASPPGKENKEDGAPAADDPASKHIPPGEKEADKDDTPVKDDAADNSKSEDDEPALKGDDDGGEDHDDAGKSDDDADPEFPVREGDKETPVKLSELRAGYLRQADYTRKTQEVAEQRKAVEVELVQTRQARAQYAGVLAELQKRLTGADGERTEEQWNELRGKDPAAYAQEYTDFQRRKAQRDVITAEQNRVRAEQVREEHNRIQTYVNGERDKLHAALPDLRDPIKAKAWSDGIRAFAKENFGFTDQELDKAFDSRVLLLADMAMKGVKAAKAAQTAKDKLAKAPELPANRTPGPKNV